jgi:serine/threonine-protein kinase
MSSKTPVSTVGKYQIIELVGEGAMGTVYRALDPLLNRTVAVKVMSDGIARDGTLRDRFMREAQAAGSLQHPNVVTIYDFGEFSGHLYIAMEFVDGIDLEQLIQQRVPLTLDQQLGIVIDVLVGLSYAHKRGVVHRDIKPGNIRLSEEGRAKIMDFGVAHLESAKMTATGVMVGTPNYMSPEQVTGQKVSAASDIFSMGAVLYELLTHRAPFSAESLHNVLFKVVSEDPPPLAIVAPDLPPALDPILRKALAKEPVDRYQSAQEMANDLTAVRAKLSGGKASSLSLGATIASQTAEHKARKARAALGGAWSPPRVIAASLVLAGGLVGGTWLLASRGSVPNSDEGPTMAAVSPLPRIPPRSDTITGGAAADSAIQPPARQEPPPANDVARSGAAPAPREPAERTPPLDPTRERALDGMRATALQARARAARAGASDALLAPGDTLLLRAVRMTQERRYAPAESALDGAITSWRNLEQQLVLAAASRPETAAGTRRGDSTPLREPVAPPPAAPGGPPSSATVPMPAPRVEPPPPPLGTVIAAVVADYARAIGSRDLSAIRAVYPAISADQQSRFQQFFQSVRSVTATLTPSDPSGDDSVATARVTGRYEYVDASGKPQVQEVGFNATFRREGAVWRIVSVR